jgi:hypothetical protein
VSGWTVTMAEATVAGGTTVNTPPSASESLVSTAMSTATPGRVRASSGCATGDVLDGGGAGEVSDPEPPQAASNRANTAAVAVLVVMGREGTLAAPY